MSKITQGAGFITVNNTSYPASTLSYSVSSPGNIIVTRSDNGNYIAGPINYTEVDDPGTSSPFTDEASFLAFINASFFSVSSSSGGQGPQGPAGTPGSVWRDGTGAPSNSLGLNNDFYLNDSNGDVYKRAGGAYSLVTNIKGPQGAQGPSGGGSGGSLPSPVGADYKFLMAYNGTVSWIGINGLIVQGLTTTGAAISGGTVGASAVANTTALADTQLAAQALGYTVLLPGGSYDFITHDWKDARTKIQGAGWMQTTMRCVNAVPLIKAGIHPGNNIEVWGGGLHDMTLDGDGVGTIGIELHAVAWFELSGLRVINFNTNNTSGMGLYSEGALTYTVRNCFFGANYVSAKLKSGSATTEGGTGIYANMIRFENNIFGGNAMGSKKWAMDVSEGAMVLITGGDFEYNGNGQDANSGALWIHDMNYEQNDIGVIIDKTWFENNTGHVIKIENSYRPTTFQFNNMPLGFSESAISLLNVSGYNNRVILNNCKIDGQITGQIPSRHVDVIVQNNAIIETHNCERIHRIKEMTGGRFYENGQPSEYPMGNGGTNFDTAVQALNPLYYNDMAGTSSPIAPKVGTGNATATGGVSFGTPSPFVYDPTSGAVMFNDTESATALNIAVNIPAGHTEIIQLWWSCDSPGWDNNFVFNPTAGTWNSTPGGWALAENQAESAYFGVTGSAGTADGIGIPRVRKVGWNCHALRIANGRFVSYHRNGIKMWTNGAASNGSTNEFGNGTFAWRYGYRVGALAILPGTVTDAQLVSLYKSKYN